MATSEEIWAFLVDFLQGVPEGDLTSIVAVTLVGVLLLRLILPRIIFSALVRLAILGTMGAATYLGYLHAQENFGQQAAYGVVAAGGILLLMAMTVMVSNTKSGIEHRNDPSYKDRDKPTFRTVHPGVEQMLRPGESGQADATRGRDTRAATPGQSQGGLLAQFGAMDPTQRQNLFSTVAFMFIAEFGVFSSVTITAPDPVVGAAFFVVFHLAAILYIWTSYRDPKHGLKHYAVVAVASVAVALLLYYTWTPADEVVALQSLFPWQFFKQPTMVASVTGVAFSLIISAEG